MKLIPGQRLKPALTEIEQPIPGYGLLSHISSGPATLWRTTGLDPS